MVRKMIKIISALIIACTFSPSVATEYMSITSERSGVYAGLKKTGWGFFTQKKELTDFYYDKGLFFSNIGIGVASKNKYHYFFNKDGVILGSFSGLDSVIEGDGWKWGYRKGLNFGVIDLKTMKLNPATYKYITNFEKGKAWVSVGNKFGLIDENEQFIIKPKYDGFREANIKTGESVVFCKKKNGESIAFVITIKEEIVAGSGC
jgi:hypothetical protein